MFYGCALITSLNLSNFDTSQVTLMNSMFDGCVNLEYINIKNFVEIKLSSDKDDYNNIFNKCPENVVICINEDRKTNSKLLEQIKNKTCYTINCSKNWKSKQKKIINQTGQCRHSCDKSISYKYEYNGKCYENCINGYLYDNKNNIINKCKCELEKCLTCSTLALKMNLCNECNTNFYPVENDSSNIGEYINCYKGLKGYYLDKNDLLLKKCYDTCKTCEKKGNNIIHNCLECDNNYLVSIKFNNYKNCYKSHVFRNNIKHINKIQNVLKKSKNVIEEIRKKQEVNNSDLYGILLRNLDNDFSYQYNPLDLAGNENMECININSDSSKIELGACETRLKDNYNIPDNVPLCVIINESFMEGKQSPNIQYEVYYLLSENNRSKLDLSICKDLKIHISIGYNPNSSLKLIQDLIKNEQNQTQGNDEEKIINYHNKIIHYVNQYIQSELTSSLNVNGEEYKMIQTQKMRLIITTQNIQNKNINDSIVMINLGECEKSLRRYYNISDKETLYLKIIEVLQEETNLTKVEYEIYGKLQYNNLTKLNISECNEDDIYISKPFILSENPDKLNTSSGYFRDICYISTSDSGTDIILEDRKKIYIDGNKAVCQEDCVFWNYNYDLNRANCSCKATESPLSFADMRINKTKLYENLVDIKNIANIKILKCQKVLFNKNGILYNIGFYFILFILIFHIICIIIFYTKDWHTLKNKIKELFFRIKNSDLLKQKGKDKNIKNKQRLKLKNNIIKTDRITSSNNKKEDNSLIVKFGKNQKAKKKKAKAQPLKEGKKQKLNTNDNKSNNSNKNTKKNIKAKVKSNSNMEEQNKIENIKNILEYKDDEKNELPYELAIKYDIRTYCEYYISLLKTKHNLIFTFFYDNDYNSKFVKIDLFIISFTINYTVNALFYDNDTMHKIYERKGSFDLEIQLPKIIYSSLISIGITLLLKFLALSHSKILEFKNNKSKEDLDERKIDLEKKLRIIFIIYFILGFLFLIFFWYYVAMFCAVYRNTQLHLLKDTLISFCLSLIYPFGINLLPGLFRIPALSNFKKKKKCLYDFSKVLQIL